MHKGVLKSISYLYILQAVGNLLPLITVPYLSWTLGLRSFGEVQIALSFAAIGTIFTDWGFALSGTHSVAKLKSNGEFLSSFVVNAIAVKFILYCLWFILSIFVDIFYYHGRLPAYFFMTLMIILSNAFAPVWIYQGLERFTESSVTNISARILSTVLIFVFVKSPDDAMNVLLLNVIAGLVISSILWMRLPFIKQFRVSMVSIPTIRKIFTEGSEVFLTTIMISWYTSCALIIVGLVGGSHAAGLYAISEKIVSAAKSLMNPVVQVLYVRISSIVNISRTEFLSVTRSYFVLLFACFALGCVLLVIFRNIIFNLVFHVSDAGAGAVLVPLVLTLPVLVLAHWCVTLGLLGRGRRREWRNVIVSGPIISICAAAVLYPLLSTEVAIAYSVLAAELGILTFGYRKWIQAWQ
jgi:polysaccharide transporter, PST family